MKLLEMLSIWQKKEKAHDTSHVRYETKLTVLLSMNQGKPQIAIQIHNAVRESLYIMPLRIETSGSHGRSALRHVRPEPHVNIAAATSFKLYLP